LNISNQASFQAQRSQQSREKLSPDVSAANAFLRAEPESVKVSNSLPESLLIMFFLLEGFRQAI
jgi:hypothetical protein